MIRSVDIYPPNRYTIPMPKNDPITWTTETRRLGELRPWERNPREIRRPQAKRLAESFDEFGQVETLAIGPGDEVYNGHQRLNVLEAEHGADFEVDVRVASRPLTERERQKLTIFLHKGAAGEFNFDALANNFDTRDLLDWGFTEYDLGLNFIEVTESTGGASDKDRNTLIRCPECSFEFEKLELLKK